MNATTHDDVIKWKHFPRNWPYVRGIYRSPVNSPHKGQWRGDLMFSLICAWINGWVNNRDAGGLRRHRAHYDVAVMRKQWVRSFIHDLITVSKGSLVTEWAFEVTNSEMEKRLLFSTSKSMPLFIYSILYLNHYFYLVGNYIQSHIPGPIS